MTLEARIEKLLKIKNYSDNHIGQRINKTAATVRNIKKGNTLPNYEFVCFLFEEFKKLNPEWFFFGKGEMFFIQSQYEMSLAERVYQMEHEKNQNSAKIANLADLVEQLRHEVEELK